ncbi:hypothetical protein [Streptomyces chrestomyceticus]|uniref:hypothetical protein n=1 Tax=Streptomyces chrestomyceticus TaxID=68185 RepID=UPI0033F5ABA2
MALMKKPGRHAGRPADRGLWAFIRTHPARVYSVVASGVALLAVYAPQVLHDQDAILAFLAALLWGGDAVQRCENTKTRDAGTAPPDDAGN